MAAIVLRWPREIAGALAKALIRHSVANARTRTLLNGLYLRLNAGQRRFAHSKFAKIFRGVSSGIQTGEWVVEFLGRKVRLPLRQESMWLDWDTAISILGHDTEVKETYAYLIRSETPPELFIDIGANYGTHSLLFLTHGIRTMTFEPNVHCHDYFRTVCLVNGVMPRLEPVALGSESGFVDLSFPEQDTWLGSTSAPVMLKIADMQNVTTWQVPRKTLDEYLPELEGHRVLMKIDVEGSELEVLRGASMILRKVRPLVLFESWPDDRREGLLGFFRARDYVIAPLPWKGPGRVNWNWLDFFAGAEAINFIAVPQEVI